MSTGRHKGERCRLPQAAIQNGVTPVGYREPHANANDFAALYIARRYRLSLPFARIIAGLAQIGERLA